MEAEALVKLYKSGKRDFQGVNLNGADLRDVNLSEVDLSKADLSEADLRRANLSRVDLRKARLRGANLFRTDLDGADLSGANLTDAKVSMANLNTAHVSGNTILPDGSECKTKIKHHKSKSARHSHPDRETRRNNKGLRKRRDGILRPVE